MNERISGTASFCCSKCNASYSLGDDDFHFQVESSSERGMGQETQYISEYVNECESCGQRIHIEFEVWEYPVGVINLIQKSEDGVVNTKCEFEFISSLDESNHEEGSTRVVGAVAGGAILGASLGGPFGAVIGGVIGGFLGDSVNKSKKDGINNG